MTQCCEEVGAGIRLLCPEKLSESSSLCLSVNFSETLLGFDRMSLVTLYSEVSCRQLLLLLETNSRVYFAAIPALCLALCRLEHGYCFFVQVLGPNSTANSIMAAYQQKRMVTPVVQG